MFKTDTFHLCILTMLQAIYKVTISECVHYTKEVNSLWLVVVSNIEANLSFAMFIFK